MGDWWQQNIIDAEKVPLLLCSAAFVLTFLATRAITRMIRAGVGPFRDNVRPGGTHVHHAVYGVVLLVLGALVAVGPSGSPYEELAAVAVGAGTSLVLDEFALILHLRDVYWTKQGRLSVEMVSLTAACLMFALVGVLPYGIEDVGPAELTVRAGLATVSVVHALVVVVCAAKGKYRTALFGWFVPGIAWVGAVRLARPDSMWARHWYRGGKLARAERRAERFDARWNPIGDWLGHLVAGTPRVSTDVPDRR
jgi:hypothetical protein